MVEWGPSSTFELALEILLGAECAGARGLITEEIQPEGVDDVDNLLAAFLEPLVGFFGGRVGAGICERSCHLIPAKSTQAGVWNRRGRPTKVVGTQGDLLAVDLVNGIVDLLDVVTVGDDLVASHNVLQMPIVSN